jgi:transcriptional regulator with XRE-family HTH domain
MHIGNSIRLFRDHKQITQAELGARTGLSPNFISRLERGFKSPSQTTVELIAKALDIPASLFYVLADDQVPHFHRIISEAYDLKLKINDIQKKLF